MPGDTTGSGRCLSDAQQMSLPWAWGDGVWRKTLEGNPPQS